MAAQEGERGGFFKRALRKAFVVEESGVGDPASGDGALDPAEFGVEKSLDPVLDQPVSSVGAPESESVIDADFPTLYARVITDGDPHADAVLEAYSGMMMLEEVGRRTAIGAMLKGLRADAAAIAGTLGRRLQVLQAAARQVKETAAKAQEQRASALAALEAETRERVAAFQQEIASLNAKLNAEVRSVQDAQAESHGRIAAYDERVKAEQLRLGQLVEFLRSLTAAAKTK